MNQPTNQPTIHPTTDITLSIYSAITKQRNNCWADTGSFGTCGKIIM